MKQYIQMDAELISIECVVKLKLNPLKDQKAKVKKEGQIYYGLKIPFWGEGTPPERVTGILLPEQNLTWGEEGEMHLVLLYRPKTWLLEENEQVFFGPWKEAIGEAIIQKELGPYRGEQIQPRFPNSK